MSQKTIVVVGSSNTDMVIKSSHLPRPGETVLGGEFVINPGGKGANQAVAAARLGGNVVFIARVGDDDLGKAAVRNFKDQGIDTSYITFDSSAASGVALIMVDENGENSISVALGANGKLGKDHMQPALDVLKASPYVLTQLESPLELIEHLVELSRICGFKLVLNPAPAQHLSDEILSALHIITPNEIEAGLLSGIPVNDVVSARKAAHELRIKGVETVIITLGGEGAYVLSDELDELVPAKEVDVVDTTAAGDTFNGALMVALAEGQDLLSSIRFANAAAGYAVGLMGAQSSAPRRVDLDI